ncbi:hypothetical protein BDA96_05G033800 [Sorghum bicolor]|uniref:Uncharacterized protein n=1 Tax=Sorghum bicolor TaxID=4558 RepID=A0A921QVM0_SORBI|nr:hypothetical protein BDA96_05G033800 [Sorghum bicolor]
MPRPPLSQAGRQQAPATAPEPDQERLGREAAGRCRRLDLATMAVESSGRNKGRQLLCKQAWRPRLDRFRSRLMVNAIALWVHVCMGYSILEKCELIATELGWESAGRCLPYVLKTDSFVL